MKTLITILFFLTLGATFARAQGLISIASRPVGSIQTNTSFMFTPAMGITGPIPTQPQAGAAYYFALLIASTTTAGDTSPLGADWSQAVIATGSPSGTPGNFITASNSVNLVGGVSGTGGVGGVGVAGWAPGTAMDVMLVGWSANLGTSWSQISSQLFNGWENYGYFGYSAIANVTSGGAGSPASPAVSIFGAGIQGFDLFINEVPEPTPLALAGLGCLSLLLLRRRKA